MKIGFFTSIEGWGGSEMYLLRLMRGVRERGHEVLLFGVEGTRLWDEAGKVGIERVAWRSIQPVGGRVLGVEREGDLRVGDDPESTLHSPPSTLHPPPSTPHRLLSTAKQSLLHLMPGGLKLFAGSVREILHLRRLFKAHPVDVMHVNVHGYEVAGVACRMAGIASVGMYCVMPHSRRRGIQNWLVYISASAYSTLCAKSNGSKNAWCDFLRLRERRFHVIPNGISITGQACKREYLPVSVLKVVYVGRLHTLKYIDRLLEVVSLCPPQTVELLIVGDGESKDDLLRVVSDLEIQDRVRWIGHVESPSMYYETADCFVFPPSVVEGCPNSMLEAMATGLPVMTFNVPPMDEINIDGVTGYNFAVEDTVGFARALIKLKDDVASRETLGVAAYDTVLTAFSWAHTLGSTVALYSMLRKQEKDR